MLAILARASFEGALLAAAVWTFCRVLPRLSPHVRALLWWCVAAKFVVSLVWRAPIGVPVLPPQQSAKSTSSAVSAIAAPAPRVESLADAPARASADAINRSTTPDIPWTAIVIAVWSLGVGITLARTLRSWFETRGVVSRSVAGDAPLRAVVHELSTLLALRQPADVRVSAEIESPLITGVLRPVILVPRDLFPTLTAEQQRMTLCHELAHMKRGDLWLGCVPALVERCFFFHPLARLAAREYAFWREAACDDAVLVALGASPQSYGRLLLALGVSRQPATFAAAGAAWSFSNLKRRITMLGSQSSPSFGARMLTAGAIAVAVLAIVPVKAVARTAESAAVVTPIGAADAEFEGASASVPSLVLAPVQDRRDEERRAQERRDQERREQELRARERERQAREELREDVRVQRDRDRRRETERRAIVETRERDRDRDGDRDRDRDRDDDLNFVYFSGENDQTSMSGSSADRARAQRLRRSNERLLWFRRDGQEYVVRDPRVLREVEELWEPVSRIGSQQGMLGAKQSVIGTEQGRFGAKQGEVGAKQGIVGARQGVVAAQLGLLSAREAQGLSSGDRRDIERQREALTRDMRALDKEMEALGREMRALTPPRELNSEMSELGRRMSVLGEQMGVASRRANTGMRELTERAIRSGAAEIAR